MKLGIKHNLMIYFYFGYFVTLTLSSSFRAIDVRTETYDLHSDSISSSGTIQSLGSIILRNSSSDKRSLGVLPNSVKYEFISFFVKIC